MKFDDKVYTLVKKIPAGMVTTYKEIAIALGCKAYRAVGNSLNRNKNLGAVLCCKVVKSDGRLGGFATGQMEKIRRLEKEGILVRDGRIIDFEKRLFRFEKK